MDWAILYWIQDNMRCVALDAFFPYFTQLGEAGAIWVVIGVTLLFSKKYRKTGLMLLIALLVCLVIGNIILKPLVMRPRPCWLDEGVKLLVKVPTDYSFPSGHTYASVLSAVILWKEKKAWGIAATAVAVMMAFSRLYLFVHFPTDVLAGVVIGLIIGFGTEFCYNVIKYRMKGE